MKLRAWLHRIHHNGRPKPQGAPVGEAAPAVPWTPLICNDTPAGRWAETVLRFGYQDLLTGLQNTVVFGSRVMGRDAVMKHIADLINKRYAQERHAAIYVDIREQVTTATLYNFTSVDAVFRDLVRLPFGVNALPADEQTAREGAQHLVRLEALLGVPLGKYNLLAVRDVVLQWLDSLSVQNLTLVVDELSALAPEFTPILLQMLLDTFPRGGRITFRLGGEKQAMRLQERARKGALGMQVNHDILISLDLEQVLQSTDVKPSYSDPRQALLLGEVERISPSLAASLNEKPHPSWACLFDPPEAWYRLYESCEWNVELVVAALEYLLPALAEADGSKANIESINRATQFAKTHAGSSRPSPQSR